MAAVQLDLEHALDIGRKREADGVRRTEKRARSPRLYSSRLTPPTGLPPRTTIRFKTGAGFGAARFLGLFRAVACGAGEEPPAAPCATGG